MRNVISFCIYGENNEKKQKYRKGLLENIDIIKSELPEFMIYIAAGCDVEDEYIEKLKSTYDKVIVKKVDFTGHPVTIERFLIFDEKEVEVLFSRDADSRIDERDIWCMKEFMKSDAHIHLIRDHKEHTMPIMAGMCGFKKTDGHKICFGVVYNEFVKMIPYKNFYGIDQQFLIYFYNLRVKKLIHSNQARASVREVITPIPIPLKDDVSFIGNTIDYDASGNRVYVYKHEV